MALDPRFGLVARRTKASLPLEIISLAEFSAFRRNLRPETRAFLEAVGYQPRHGAPVALPDERGGFDRFLVVRDPKESVFELFGGLALRLPAGDYHLLTEFDPAEAREAAIGFGAGRYRFDRYLSKSKNERARLQLPRSADVREVERTLDAIYLARDLINTPTNDLGPSELAAAARTVARKYRARVTTVVGEKLLEKNYPLIHAVGRASADAPRLIDMRFGSRGKEIVLVGKGVCFDTGGLDLKPASAMKLMKKDMGGAAHALALASMIMAAELPVRLRVLIPAVENSVSGTAFRPLDVLESRSGKTIEVGNTDAEGRLILADALAAAGKPDLLIDFATLTGAARVALGSELPALFTNDDALAGLVLEASEELDDPIHRLPLHAGYRKSLSSEIADLNNISDGPYGGAITAALFLEHFVEDGVPWAHFDVMAWNLRSRPGRPRGGELMGVRAVYRAVERFLSASSNESATGRARARRS